MIKDSGQRTKFDSGAQRDMHGGKGSMISLAPNAMLRLSKHLELGAEKYGLFNYQKGIPLTSFLDSALRHLFKYIAGWDDEDHLAAAMFNIMGALEMEHTHKELIDLPGRQGKNTFDYVDESQPLPAEPVADIEEVYELDGEHLVKKGKILQSYNK